MKKVFTFLNNSVCAWRAPFNFAAHSTVGCGGNAPIAFYPQTVEEFAELISALTEQGLPYKVLGNLSNVLPPDGEVDYAVVSTKRLCGVTVRDKIFALAGTTAGELLRVCRENRLGGGEFLTGIPCTIGGATYMNAGADGKYIAEILDGVLVLREGKLLQIPVKECGYAYKQSVFMDNGDIILGGALRLEESSMEEISERERYYRLRRAHLPKGRSMGCVFKNPPDAFAGELIERSGLKGLRLGGARIANEHANFILNEQNATAGDVKGLIALIKNAVYAQYGVELQEEIRYL